MSKRDYYEVLGLTRTASDDDIKQAYRKLARKYHPDVSTEADAEVRFKEINEANQVLSDPEKRQAYNMHGHATTHQNTNPSGWTYTNGNTDFADIFSEIFRQNPEFFGGPGPNREKPKPRHLVNMTLEDAYSGKTFNVGNGTILNVPAGARNGTKFFVNDAIYQVNVQPHMKFKRSNDDLLVDVQIDAIEAMLSVDVTLTHLDGNAVQFTIPIGIQNQQIVKLAGKGMKNPENDRYGDLLIRVSITIPRTLSQEHREQLKSLPRRSSINI